MEAANQFERAQSGATAASIRTRWSRRAIEFDEIEDLMSDASDVIDVIDREGRLTPEVGGLQLY